MPLDHLATMTLNHFIGRTLRRAMIAAIIAVFAIIAVYQYTMAGMMALTTNGGELQARLIVGGVYTVLALISLAVLWAIRTRPFSSGAPTLASTREMQMVMLVEAVMLGYALARKGERAN